MWLHASEGGLYNNGDMMCTCTVRATGRNLWHYMCGQVLSSHDHAILLGSSAPSLMLACGPITIPREKQVQETRKFDKSTSMPFRSLQMDSRGGSSAATSFTLSWTCAGAGYNVDGQCFGRHLRIWQEEEAAGEMISFRVQLRVSPVTRHARLRSSTYSSFSSL